MSMSEKIQPALTDWSVIAVYVGTVAQKAFMRGFSVACQEADFPIDREAQLREARYYAGSGFEPETVQQFHPGFGFTREDVAVLRGVAQTARSGDAGQMLGDGENIESLADRIEALLPPDK